LTRSAIFRLTHTNDILYRHDTNIAKNIDACPWLAGVISIH